MARDRCLREDCWDSEIGVKYQPIDGKKLLVWPDSKCLDSLSREDRITFLRELKTKYGFSLISLAIDHNGNQEVAEAGWSVDEIVVNASGYSLNSLSYMYDFWSNKFADEQMSKLGLSSKDNYQLWLRFKQNCPAFYSVFYDEPLSYRDKEKMEWPLIPDYTYPELVMASMNALWQHYPNIGTLLHDLCNNISIFNEYFKADPNLRFVLMSLYVHACLNTKFVIGEPNTLGKNYWRSVLKFFEQIPPLSYWPNWIDSIAYQAYHSEWGWSDQSVEWETLDKAGWSGGRAWISLQMDRGEFDTLLNKANELHWNEIWLFPQDNDNTDWEDCDTYKRYLMEFLDAAARNGFVRRIPITERRCITYRIPGCKDGAIVEPDPFFEPFINRNPIFP